MAFGAYGYKTLTALSAAIIAPAADLAGGGSLIIQNLDTGGPIYIGNNDAVRDTNGTYVPAMLSGVPGVAIILLVPGKTPTVYGYSVAGQTAPANTRYRVDPAQS